MGGAPVTKESKESKEGSPVETAHKSCRGRCRSRCGKTDGKCRRPPLVARAAFGVTALALSPIWVPVMIYFRLRYGRTCSRSKCTREAGDAPDEKDTEKNEGETCPPSPT